MLSALDEIGEGPGQTLDYTPLAYGVRVSHGPISVHFHRVDHDTPGASSIFIETPDVRLLYSGDLRLHGAHPEWTREFAQLARAFQPHALFIEGTRAIGEESVTTEAELSDLALQLTANSAGGAYFNAYRRHPERYLAFYNAAKQTGRTLILQPETAYLVHVFEGLADFAVWSDPSIQLSQPVRDWIAEKQIPSVTANDVAHREASYLMELTYDRFWLLSDIAPEAGGVFMHANGSPLGPYDPAWDNMLRWLEHYGLAFESIGSTGHASRNEICAIIEEIQPQVVMPIHSFNPERIGSTSVRRILPELLRPYTLASLADAPYPTEADLAPTVEEA